MFAEQAKAAGVTVNVNKVDPSVFYGKDYLKWPFAQDFWGTRNYLARPARAPCRTRPTTRPTGRTPSGWRSSRRRSRRSTTPSATSSSPQAQKIEYDKGGYIVWSFDNQVDAYSKKTTGYKLDKLGGPIGRMYFKDVYFTA